MSIIKKMLKLKFDRVCHGKHGTSTINIFGASFKLDEDCEILEINKTEYNYQKVIVKLSPEKVEIIKKIEEELNNYLETNGLSQITIVYGNRIYPKKKKFYPIDQVKRIKFKGVFVNNEKRLFPQLWLEI